MYSLDNHIIIVRTKVLHYANISIFTLIYYYFLPFLLANCKQVFCGYKCAKSKTLHINVGFVE